MPHRPPHLNDPEILERMHRTAGACFRDEALAPPIDRGLLLALVRRQLPADQARSVYQLIHSFRSWNDAHTQVLIEEFRREADADPPPVAGDGAD